MGMRKFGVGIAIKNNVEAVAFYKKVFGLELGFYEKFPDGTYQHAELKKDGEVVFGVVGLIHDLMQKSKSFLLVLILIMKPRCLKHLIC